MERMKGIVLIVVGSMFWGATGPMIEWLMEARGMHAAFLLAVRLVIAGVIILAVVKRKGTDIFAVWRERVWLKQLLLFSLVGMVGLQYTFVKAIEVSDAVIATLLQFLAPIFIVAYVSLRSRKWPPKRQVIGITGTLVGLVLLMTNGSPATLVVSAEALIWGVFLGLTYAFYTLYPARLMKEWGVLTVIGWGMIVSGVVFSLLGQVWSSPNWQLLATPELIVLFIALIIFGTLAYILFMLSLNYISAVEVSVLSSVEPLTAMAISVLWLGATFQLWQLIGIALMLFFVVYLSIGGKR